MAVAGTAHQVWDRHSILAEIKRRFGSLRAFAATTPLGIGHYSVALGRSYPAAEKIISDGLGIPLHQLWPDRYDSRGRRRMNASRAPAPAASQNVRKNPDIARTE